MNQFIFLLVFLFNVGNTGTIRVKRGYGYSGSGSYRSQNYNNYNNGYYQQSNLGGYGWNSYGSMDPSRGQGIYSEYSNYYHNNFPQNGYKSYGTQTNTYQRGNNYVPQPYYPNQVGFNGPQPSPPVQTGFINHPSAFPPSISPGFAADLKPETKPLLPPPQPVLPSNVPVIHGTQTLIPDPTPSPTQEQIPPVGGFAGDLGPVQKPPDASDSCFAGNLCRVPQLETTGFPPTIQPNMPDPSQIEPVTPPIPHPLPDITPAVNAIPPDITPVPSFAPDLAPPNGFSPPPFPDTTLSPPTDSISEGSNVNQSPSIPTVTSTPILMNPPPIPTENAPLNPPSSPAETSWTDSQDDAVKKGLAINSK